MADVEEFKDSAGHYQQEHHVRGDEHHAHRDEEEPRDPSGDVIETFEQVTHGQLTSEEHSAGHHHIHSEDEPLKPADDILLDEETAPADDAVEDSGAELIEAEKEEDAEVDGIVVEPTEEPEAEVETSDVVQAENVDDAELEENKEEKGEDDRKSGDGETENVRFEEVPAEIITTTENESLPTEAKEVGGK